MNTVYLEYSSYPNGEQFDLILYTMSLFFI